MPDIADDNGNGKITMAVLGTKLDIVISRLDELAKCRQADHDTVIEHSQILEDRGRRIAALEDGQRARAWEARIVEMLLAIATALGFLRAA